MGGSADTDAMALMVRKAAAGTVGGDDGDAGHGGTHGVDEGGASGLAVERVGHGDTGARTWRRAGTASVMSRAAGLS